ncbi:MAG TPA: LysE family transporter [Symbiobacteriaceae bacterium]|nr:LysE family transporter [Symbiobacteriaceae bacterium]
MDWVAFTSYIFVASFTPGPNNIMSMTNGIRVGLRKSLRFNLGVAAGFFVLMALCSYLSLALASLLPRFRLAMSLVGAAYMLFLAVKVAFSTDSAPEAASEAPSSFWAGLGLQFLNPKGIMYALTVVGNFLLPHFRSQAFLLVALVLLGFFAFISTTSWSLFGATFQRLLTRHRRPFNAAMGLLLAYCAVSAFL